MAKQSKKKVVKGVTPKKVVKRKAKRVPTTKLKDNVKRSAKKKVAPIKPKESDNRSGKRKAKRTYVNKPKGVIKRTRKKSSYDIIQSAISKYCKERYARLMASNELSAEEKKRVRKTCTKAEINEIYNSLKGRFLKDAKDIKGRSKDKISPSEIASKIDSILGYYGANDIPLQLREPIEWYYIIDYLLNNDGLFFKENDILVFNCSTLDKSLGQYEVFYKDVDIELGDTMYVDLRQFIDENPEYDDSPIPEFVLNEELSDIENRTFVWDLVVLDSFIDRKEERGGSKITEEVGTEDFDLSEEDLEGVRKEVEELKESVGGDIEVDLESKRLLALEKERTKQRELDLEIERERRLGEEAKLQQTKEEKELVLLRMLESGKISFEQYVQLKG